MLKRVILLSLALLVAVAVAQSTCTPRRNLNVGPDPDQAVNVFRNATCFADDNSYELGTRLTVDAGRRASITAIRFYNCDQNTARTLTIWRCTNAGCTTASAVAQVVGYVPSVGTNTVALDDPVCVSQAAFPNGLIVSYSSPGLPYTFTPGFPQTAAFASMNANPTFGTTGGQFLPAGGSAWESFNGNFYYADIVYTPLTCAPPTFSPALTSLECADPLVAPTAVDETGCPATVVLGAVVNEMGCVNNRVGTVNISVSNAVGSVAFDCCGALTTSVIVPIVDTTAPPIAGGGLSLANSPQSGRDCTLTFLNRDNELWTVECDPRRGDVDPTCSLNNLVAPRANLTIVAFRRRAYNLPCVRIVREIRVRCGQQIFVNLEEAPATANSRECPLISVPIVDEPDRDNHGRDKHNDGNRNRLTIRASEVTETIRNADQCGNASFGCNESA